MLIAGIPLARKKGMKPCESCGNIYEKSFEIVLGGQSHVFDSFECAIHKLAPRCGHCEIAVVGHGVETGGQIYCCAHCADTSRMKDIQDQPETTADPRPPSVSRH